MRMVTPPPQPLSHHEIIGLAEPFVRAGWSVDLAGTDRVGRCLAFKAIERGNLREVLTLDSSDPGDFVLQRLATGQGGPSAALRAAGSPPAALLAQVAAVDAGSQFRSGTGFALALSQRLTGEGLLLTHAELCVDNLVLALRMPSVSGFPAELELTAAPGAALALPDDLLEVLGADWARLSRHSGGWRGTLRLPGREPAASRRAEQRLEAAAHHLARTLAEPPAKFHARLATQRWRVALRNSVPLLGVLGLIGAALAVPTFAFAQDSVLRLLVQTAPPLLLAFGVCRREMPRIEWPRWPRASRAASWRVEQ